MPDYILGDRIIVAVIYIILAALLIWAHFTRKRDKKTWTKNMRPAGRYDGRWR